MNRSIALLLATVVFLQPGPTRLEARQQQPKKQKALTEKDSLKALNRAVQSLRGYQRQLQLLELIASRVRTASVGNTVRGILGIARPDSLAILWQESPTTRVALEARAINLSLATLSPGRYIISLSIDVPGQQRVVSRREIEILSRR